MTTQSESAPSPRDGAPRPQRSKKDRHARKYGFACANCRRRKARCNGELPNCDRCLTNNEACYFDKAPSVTYALSLQDRLKTSEAILERLRNASEVERSQLLDEHFNSIRTHPKPPRASDINSGAQRDSPQSDVSAEDGVAELLNETTVGEDGRICFYGRTSLYHLQPEQTVLVRRPGGGLSEAIPYQSIIRRESINSLAAPSPAPSQQTDLGSIITAEISQELVDELLDVYWCWPHHLHLVLCRKIFMRDLANSGPYVTVFLLNSTLAQAARFSDRQDASTLSAYFAKKALDCLAEEIDRGSSIPTLQGLLILSARECASGRTSQGWLYSGMAFRMMHDLGIHIHPRSLSHLVGQFSPQDLALRQQVFWSCYTWDKTMSLCLGRAPTIHETMAVPEPETWLDGEEAENEAWYPHFSTSISPDVGVAQMSSTNSRFSAYCHLCIMIDDVLDTLYSRPHARQNHLCGYLELTLTKLEDWARKLPSHLYIQESSRIVICPPLHILLLNLLYHATIILLCRPYRAKDPKARTTATKAADMIDRLLTLHVRRFGFRVLTYLETYTVFVAATVNILDLKEGKDEEAEASNARLAFNVELLRNAHSTPSTMRCVEIIEQCLRKDSAEKFARTGTAKSQPTLHHQSLPPPLVSHPSHPELRPHGRSFPGQFRNLAAAQPDETGSNEFSFLNSMTQDPLNMPMIYDSAQLVPDPPTGLTSNESSPMQVNGSSSFVDRPLRWLPDNLRDDCSWMMMGMDFANPFDGRRT